MGGWIHYVANCGGVDGLVAKAKALNLKWLTVKWSDGSTFGDQNSATVFRDQFIAVVTALTAAGFDVFAWSYIYGNDPLGEADRIAACVAAGAKGIILDAEYEYVGKESAAVEFFARLMPQLPKGFPVAFAPDFRILVANAYAPWTEDKVNLSGEPWPWKQFVAKCSAVMPQQYFSDFKVSPSTVFGLVDCYNAACAREGWPAIPVLPILPLNATANDLQSARDCVKQRGMDGYSYWLLG